MRANIQVYGNNAAEVIENWRAEAQRFFGIKPRVAYNGPVDPNEDRTYAGYDVSVVELAGDDPKAGGARYRASLRTFQVSMDVVSDAATGVDALKLHLGRVEFGSVKEFNEAVKAEATSFYGDWSYRAESDAEPLGDGRYTMDVTLVTMQYVRKYGHR